MSDPSATLADEEVVPNRRPIALSGGGGEANQGDGRTLMSPKVDEPRPKLRGREPRFHEGHSAGSQVTGKVGEGRSYVPLRRQVADRAEQTADDVESAVEVERAHVPQDETNARQPASGDP
jgi:hypothetical protein